MKALTFRTAIMVLTHRASVSVFRDGAVNVMPMDLPSHIEHARPAGYGLDGRRYIVEHDAIHHMLADWRGERWSGALHENSFVPLDQAPEPIKDEEHLVQRTQRLVMLGEADPYGRLEAEFGDRLGEWVRRVVTRLDDELGRIKRAVSSGVGE